MTKSVLLFASLVFSLSTFAQVPTLALTFDTNVRVVNASSTQLAKIPAAEEHIKRVVATQAFKDAVINHTYGGVKKFVDNGGYSNTQIYNMILDGAEELTPTKNNTMDLEVELYYENTSTVGYTYPNTRRIWVNTKFFNYYSPEEVAGNLMHEWLHKVGFEHAYNYSTSRDYSVPYAIGYMMEELDGPETTYFNPATNLTVAAAGTGVTLRWTAASSSNGISEYKIYRKLAGATTSYLQGSTTGLTFTQTAPTTSATYYVKAVDGDGATKNSATVQYVKPSLTAPTNLSVSTTTSGLTVKWAAATGAKEYKVYRRLDTSSTAYLQGTTTSLSFTQAKPSVGAAYYVRSVDANGNTLKSVEVRYNR